MIYIIFISWDFHGMKHMGFKPTNEKCHQLWDFRDSWPIKIDRNWPDDWRFNQLWVYQPVYIMKSNQLKLIGIDQVCDRSKDGMYLPCRKSTHPKLGGQPNWVGFDVRGVKPQFQDMSYYEYLTTSITIKRPIRGVIWESTRLGNTRDLCNQTKYGIEPVFANQNMVNQKQIRVNLPRAAPKNEHEVILPGMWTTHFGERICTHSHRCHSLFDWTHLLEHGSSAEITVITFRDMRDPPKPKRHMYTQLKAAYPAAKTLQPILTPFLHEIRFPWWEAGAAALLLRQSFGFGRCSTHFL